MITTDQVSFGDCQSDPPSQSSELNLTKVCPPPGDKGTQPSGEKSGDTGSGAPAPETKPAESKSNLLSESKPAERPTESGGSKPTEKPVEAKPTESKPPVETGSRPSEQTVEPKPAGGKPAESAAQPLAGRNEVAPINKDKVSGDGNGDDQSASPEVLPVASQRNRSASADQTDAPKPAVLPRAERHGSVEPEAATSLPAIVKPAQGNKDESGSGEVVSAPHPHLPSISLVASGLAEAAAGGRRSHSPEISNVGQTLAQSVAPLLNGGKPDKSQNGNSDTISGSLPAIVRPAGSGHGEKPADSGDGEKPADKPSILPVIHNIAENGLMSAATNIGQNLADRLLHNGGKPEHQQSGSPDSLPSIVYPLRTALRGLSSGDTEPGKEKPPTSQGDTAPTGTRGLHAAGDLISNIVNGMVSDVVQAVNGDSQPKPKKTSSSPEPTNGILPAILSPSVASLLQPVLNGGHNGGNVGGGSSDITPSPIHVPHIFGTRIGDAAARLLDGARNGDSPDTGKDKPTKPGSPDSGLPHADAGSSPVLGAGSFISNLFNLSGTTGDTSGSRRPVPVQTEIANALAQSINLLGHKPPAVSADSGSDSGRQTLSPVVSNGDQSPSLRLGNLVAGAGLILGAGSGTDATEKPKPPSPVSNTVTAFANSLVNLVATEVATGPVDPPKKRHSDSGNGSESSINTLGSLLGQNVAQIANIIGRPGQSDNAEPAGVLPPVIGRTGTELAEVAALLGLGTPPAKEKPVNGGPISAGTFIANLLKPQQSGDQPAPPVVLPGGQPPRAGTVDSAITAATTLGTLLAGTFRQTGREEEEKNGQLPRPVGYVPTTSDADRVGSQTLPVIPRTTSLARLGGLEDVSVLPTTSTLIRALDQIIAGNGAPKTSGTTDAGSPQDSTNGRTSVIKIDSLTGLLQGRNQDIVPVEPVKQTISNPASLIINQLRIDPSFKMTAVDANATIADRFTSLLNDIRSARVQTMKGANVFDNSFGVSTLPGKDVSTLGGKRSDSILISQPGLNINISGSRSTFGSTGAVVISGLKGQTGRVDALGVNDISIKGQPVNGLNITISGIGKVGSVDVNSIKGKGDSVSVTSIAITADGGKTISLSGTKSDAGIAIKGDSTATNSIGIKSDATASGVKIDWSTIKADWSGTVKADGSTSVKNDAAFGIKIDGTGKLEPIIGNRIDVPGTIKGDGGIKGNGVAVKGDGTKAIGSDLVAGTTRSITPQMANEIALAIKLGLPLPAGLTFQNGEIALRYGNEVLFFPGLKAALKFAEVVGLIECDKEEETSASEQTDYGWAQENRTHYVVKETDTVESIAQQQLGDARLADLLITINRGEILYRLVNDCKVPFVYTGQTIWLPSTQEIDVYRKNFFGKKGGKAFGFDGSASNPKPLSTEDEFEHTVRVKLHDEAIANFAPPVSPRTTVKDLPMLTGNNLSDALIKLRFAGGRQSMEIPVPAKNNISQPHVVHASIDARELRDTVIVSNSCHDDRQSVETERLVETQRLAYDARVLIADRAGEPRYLSVKLELLVQGVWTLIASYESSNSGSARVRYGRNGVRSSMALDLPLEIIKNMAQEDFTRNWTLYRHDFHANKIGRGKGGESVPRRPITLERPLVK